MLSLPSPAAVAAPSTVFAPGLSGSFSAAHVTSMLCVPLKVCKPSTLTDVVLVP